MGMEINIELNVEFNSGLISDTKGAQLETPEIFNLA